MIQKTLSKVAKIKDRISKEVIAIPDHGGGTCKQPVAGLSLFRQSTGPVGPVAAAMGILATALMVGACAHPPNVKLREDMKDSIGKFGLSSFYPLSETPRIGQLYLMDASVTSTEAKNWVLLTDDLVDIFEKGRQANKVINQRFPSKAQVAESPAPALPALPALDHGLAVVAFPSFKLASIHQLAAATLIPTKLASLMESIGLREERALNMSVKKVEVAELPLADLMQVIYDNCVSTNNSVLSQDGQNRIATALLRAGLNVLEKNRRERMTAAGTELPEVQPTLVLLQAVYYLHEIEYTLDEDNVSSAQFQAVIKQEFPQKNPPPQITQVYVAPPQSSATEAGKALASLIDSVNAERDAQNKLIDTKSPNAQIAASSLRANGSGIGFNEIFTRPLAFGYEAYEWNYSPGPDKNGKQIDPKQWGFYRVCKFAETGQSD